MVIEATIENTNSMINKHCPKTWLVLWSKKSLYFVYQKGSELI